MKVVEEALEWLQKLIVDIDEKTQAANQEAFYQLGGHLAVVTVMNRLIDCHDDDGKTVQEYAIRVLTNASYNNQELRTAIAKVRGMKAILATMNKCLGEDQIIYEGLKALGNLCRCEAIAERLVKTLCGAPFIVGRMKAFSKTLVLFRKLVNS